MFRTLVLGLLLLPFFSFSQTSTVELLVRPVPKPVTVDAETLKWCQSQPGYDNLIGPAKEIFYWTNLCRNKPEEFWDSVMVPLLNAFPTLKTSESRSLKSDLHKTGQLPMFTLSPALTKTAQAHTNDIAGKKAQPSHTSTNGVDFGSRMKQAGIKRCAGENMSLGNQDVLLSVALLYLDINLPDLGHRKTLLNKDYLEMGVGISKYGRDQFFMVEDFSCTQQ